MTKPKLAQAWFDNPDAQYEKAVNDLMRSFRKGVISGSEAGMGRGTAERCRQLAKEWNARNR